MATAAEDQRNDSLCEVHLASGEVIARLPVGPTTTSRELCKAVAKQVPPRTAIQLVAASGKLLQNEETLPNAEGGYLNLLAMLKPSKWFCRIHQAAGHLSEDETRALWTKSSGGAMVEGVMAPNSGTHILRVVFANVENITYVSLGLVCPENFLSCGPGYNDNEIAWLHRDNKAQVLGSLRHPYKIEGCVPTIRSDDVLELCFDTDRRCLYCCNITQGSAFSITEVQNIPLSFAVGGWNGASAKLI